MSNFLKKNAVTVIILAATVVLAGIALFTAIRLYQLRQQSVAPNEPASSPSAAGGPLDVTPKSGNWNFPGTFVIKNITSQSVTFKYVLDCWDESVCGDKEESGTLTLAPGQSLEKGLGNVCSKWQLDLNWSGKPGNQSDVGFVAEKSQNCGSGTPTPPAGQCSMSFTITLGSTSSPSSSPTASPSQSPTPTPLGSSTPTATPTEPPRGGPSLTPSPTPTGSSTPAPTTTPKGSVTPKPSTSPTPAALPAAGVSLPTMFGIGAGFLLLLGAILLAI